MNKFTLEKVTNGWFLWYIHGTQSRSEVFTDIANLVDRLETIVTEEMEDKECQQ
jgi:hypothetical protein